MNIRFITILLMIVGIQNFSAAEDLRKIVSLSGYWKFSVGDRKSFAEPGYNDGNWDNIKVPGQWEQQGYNEYNGFAWYRTNFTIQPVGAKGPVYLLLGKIDDVDEVFLNGKKIGSGGHMPPDYKTAYNINRKYIVPEEYLNFNGNNTLAVRVYDCYLGGGIIEGPIGIYTDDDYNLLNYDLSGKWKFHLGDNKQWKEKNYNDELWPSIRVPAEWEQEGFSNYDGYAWYRKDFKVPAGLKGNTLYLIMGKIDDYDYVYINGQPLGTVFDLDKDNEYKRRGFEYNARRIYKIPTGMLKMNEVNTIAVRVYDSQLRGGIYQGPIGLMTEENCRLYRKKHYSNQSFWDFVIEGIFVD